MTCTDVGDEYEILLPVTVRATGPNVDGAVDGGTLNSVVNDDDDNVEANDDDDDDFIAMELLTIS